MLNVDKGKDGTIDERVEDVIENIRENPEAGARAAYQILGAAVDKALPELSKLVAERYKTAPGEVQKLGRFAYAVVSLDDGTDQSLLGNVTLEEANVGQQNGTLTVNHHPLGQLQRAYTLRTLTLPNGGVKLIAQEVDSFSGATGVVDTATPFSPPPVKYTKDTPTPLPKPPVKAGPVAGPAAGTAYAPSPARTYQPAAPGMPTAPTGATSYAPTAPAPLGSLFKTTAP